MVIRFIQLKVSNLLLVVLLLLYRILLDATYFVYLVPKFGYKGFELSIDWIKYSLSYLVMIVIFQFIPLNSSKNSHIIFQMLFVLMFIPLTSYYAMSNESTSWLFITSLFWLISGIITNNKLNLKPISPPAISKKHVFYMVLICVTITFILLFSYAKINFNLDILKVYEIRSQNPTAEVPFSGYIINWTAKALIPFLILYAYIINKSVSKTALYSLLLVLLFSITGHKVYLFAIPMIFGSIILLKSGQFLMNLLLTFIAIISISIFLYLIFDNEITASLFVRRTLFIPAQISFYYYDYFNENHIYLSNSILSQYIDYTKPLEPAYIIAKQYFDKEEMSANNGIISDGFMHFGIIGVIIWSLLLSFILKIIDAITTNKPSLLFLPVILIAIKSFVDGAFLTSLLTHGVLITLFISYIYPNEKQL